jgi:hypothetical protein
VTLEFTEEFIMFQSTPVIGPYDREAVVPFPYPSVPHAGTRFSRNLLSVKGALLALLLLLPVTATPGFAEMYRCVKDGRVLILDTPCPSGSVEARTIETPEPAQEISESERDAELSRLKSQADTLERQRLDRSAAEAKAREEAQKQKLAEEAEAAKAKPERRVRPGILNRIRRQQEAAGGSGSSGGSGDSGGAGSSASGGAGGAGSSGSSGDSGIGFGSSTKKN